MVILMPGGQAWALVAAVVWLRWMILGVLYCAPIARVPLRRVGQERVSESSIRNYEIKMTQRETKLALFDMAIIWPNSSSGEDTCSHHFTATHIISGWWDIIQPSNCNSQSPPAPIPYPAWIKDETGGGGWVRCCGEIVRNKMAARENSRCLSASGMVLWQMTVVRCYHSDGS